MFPAKSRILERLAGILATKDVQAVEGPPPDSSMIERIESPVAARHLDQAADAEERSPYLSAEEQRLLELARAGNAHALRKLYDTYNGQVRGHLYRLLGADPDIDDLVQTVFIRAFNALDRFKGNSALSTWLYRITANTAHNLMRQRYRRERAKNALRWFNLGRDAHVQHDNRAEVRDEARRLLARLSPDLRQIFVLYHYEGLTLQEISQIVDRPISTVGDRLTRARKKLKDLAAN